MNYKLCELYNKHKLLSKYGKNTCLRAFPLLWNVVSAREWDVTAQQFWWSWVFAHLGRNIADDAVQMDVHKTFIHFTLQRKCPMLR